jgi:AcrR family transcriptional regulator
VPRRPSAARKPAGRYHHGELRRALLDAAAEVVDRDGAGALSLRELARRLGVSHAAPAHHFADRTALLLELARDGFERFGAALGEAARREQDPLVRLQAVGRAYVRFAMEHPGRFRVMFGREAAEVGAAPAGALPEGGASWQVLVDSVAGALSAVRPEALERAEGIAFACWAAVHGAAMLWLDGPLRCTRPPEVGRARFEAGLDATFALIGEALVGARPRTARGAPRPGARAS